MKGNFLVSGPELPTDVTTYPPEVIPKSRCEPLSWEVYGLSLLGLLAKIKCSICSYQFNI